MAASIFSAEVVLDDSGETTEQIAKVKVFVDVLIKASGQLNVSENLVIQKAFPTVNQYITQLEYGNINGQRSLIVWFDDAKIRTLLMQAQTTYWGLPRPEILFWVVENTVTRRNVIWEQSGLHLIDELKVQGERRGLPVLIPVGDFDDVVTISVSDLWGGFMQPIQDASARYNPSGVAVVKIYGNELSWQLFPNITTMGHDVPIEGYAFGSRFLMFSQMINDISDFYAQHLGITLGEENRSEKQLQIFGLDSAETFFIVERILKGLNSVATVHLESLMGGVAMFRVNLLASENVFYNEIMPEHRLRRIEITEDRIEPLVDRNPVSDSLVVGRKSSIGVDAVTSIDSVLQTPNEPILRFQWNG
ncbi:DUF2066 domain-containing protein [Candidatus Enterovibrio escicola]|uniref:DUF2066 domain-containing protein n=1 Tax=Candidatus Enterovibrio escicola TaxID=1927127 RepID=UPI001CC25F5A|nr:DUF2066 domain-containing protein [Candidatus Enterovibrio escacola]